VSLIPALNLSPVPLTPLKNDTAGDNVNDDKFFAGINNTSEQLLPVTAALAINVLPVSTTPVNNDHR
jgi:hypothetical protein